MYWQHTHQTCNPAERYVRILYFILSENAGLDLFNSAHKHSIFLSYLFNYILLKKAHL